MTLWGPTIDIGSVGVEVGLQNEGSSLLPHSYTHVMRIGHFSCSRRGLHLMSGSAVVVATPRC